MFKWGYILGVRGRFRKGRIQMFKRGGYTLGRDWILGAYHIEIWKWEYLILGERGRYQRRNLT